ncbi:hypothetical protein GLAREA_10253 [Glarea lozoyensis ATCC 20868]|uniref:Ribonucleases P/MRP subunit Pop8-like domain-containing protein n=1 Tax=Glarea lozoyensis (strain ATCC 20868 / MF5171) TaxID=1116229 RepID=S3DBS3_GLAL2|nr:uncharacterized protein GLAREA_10253 [Glarea lozoyensis ATCC 20868]EPE34559.1 hypothetical protein GLAREA_10253 [Glarea lozoyensis ATCC 20868]
MAATDSTSQIPPNKDNESQNEPPTPTNPPTKRKIQPNRGHEITIKTIKSPPWSYIQLSLTSSSQLKAQQPVLDELTAKSYLTSALTQFLGLHGQAISIDFLKVEGQQVWIRVPREDRAPVLAAVGGWNGHGEGEERVGWTVIGASNWLGSLVVRDGEGAVWDG